MADTIREKLTAIGERIKVNGGEVGRKVVTTVGGKVKELLQGPTHGGRLVEEATAENLGAPDWGKFMEICDLLNSNRISGQDVVRSIKKRIATRNAGVQMLVLTLLETCVKNYEKMFSEMASEKILDEMVKMIEDPQTWSRCRDKALMLIEAWGESTEELRYLPVYEETYKSMRLRGIRFPARDSSSLAPIFTPPRSVAREATVVKTSAYTNGIRMESLSARETLDVAKNSVEILSAVLKNAAPPHHDITKEELTLSLVDQCKLTQHKIESIIQRAGYGANDGHGHDGDDDDDDEQQQMLLQALNVNDELQQVLKKYEELLCVSSEKCDSSIEAAVVTSAHIVDDDNPKSVSYDPLSDLDDDDDDDDHGGDVHHWHANAV